MENERALGKICPIMSSQSNLIYCREDCAWFSKLIVIEGKRTTNVEECVIQSIFQEISNFQNWK